MIITGIYLLILFATTAYSIHWAIKETKLDELLNEEK